VIGVNIFLASNFYPHLLKYQMGNTAADYINRSGIDKQKIVLWGVGIVVGPCIFMDNMFQA